MEEKDPDHFYLQYEEPIQGCLFALKEIILSMDEGITVRPKWGGAPFFDYKGKSLCYLWVNKKRNYPYIGITKGKYIKHKKLIKGKRKTIKVYKVKPKIDIDIEEIQEIFSELLRLY